MLCGALEGFAAIPGSLDVVARRQKEASVLVRGRRHHRGAFPKAVESALSRMKDEEKMTARRIADQ